MVRRMLVGLWSLVLVDYAHGFNPLFNPLHTSPKVQPQTATNGFLPPLTVPSRRSLPGPSGSSFLPANHVSGLALPATQQGKETEAAPEAAAEVDETAWTLPWRPAEEKNSAERAVATHTDGGSWDAGLATGLATGIFASLSAVMLVLRSRVWWQSRSSAAPHQDSILGPSPRDAVEMSESLFSMALSDPSPSPLGPAAAEPVYTASSEVRGAFRGPIVAKFDKEHKVRTVAMIGLSHKTATVDVREKLAVQEDNWQSVGKAIAELPSIKEAAVISTCNRFEIYFVTSNLRKGVWELTNFLSTQRGVPKGELHNALFMLDGDDAVWHALRVSAGLDSIVIGEGQILSQMKRCYVLATGKEGAAGKVLSRLLNTAVSAGKRVRSETAIARGGVSISSAAVELVEKNCFDDLDRYMNELDVAILGAGTMARLLVQHLMPRHPKSITVVNRGQARIEELQKQFPDANIIAAKLDNMLDVVAKSDVTFACTSAREPILYKDNLEGLFHRDAMLVDISVPRNIDDGPANQLKGVHAYNVDDLKVVVAANQARRRFIALEAEDLLQHELHEFGSWHKSLGTVPMINRLQDRAEEIRSCELTKMNRKLSGLTVSEHETVRRMTKNIVAKLLHGPLTHLRAMNEEESYENSVKSLESMFKLDEQLSRK